MAAAIAAGPSCSIVVDHSDTLYMAGKVYFFLPRFDLGGETYTSEWHYSGKIVAKVCLYVQLP